MSIFTDYILKVVDHRCKFANISALVAADVSTPLFRPRNDSSHQDPAPNDVYVCIP